MNNFVIFLGFLWLRPTRQFNSSKSCIDLETIRAAVWSVTSLRPFPANPSCLPHCGPTAPHQLAGSCRLVKTDVEAWRARIRDPTLLHDSFQVSVAKLLHD